MSSESIKPATLLLGAAAAAAVVGAGLAIRRASRPAPAQGATEVVMLDDVAAAPFPGQRGTDVGVLIPPNFRRGGPLHVWVYFRGYGNCVQSIVGNDDMYCTPGGTRRHASRLAAQLAASGSGAIVIVPELRYDAASYEPGALSRPEGLGALLEEVLGRIADRVGDVSSGDIVRLGIMSHSGGYATAAACVRASHPALRSVVLLDSLYADEATFGRWIEGNAAGFSADGEFRFADFYTDTGGTDDRSRSLADRVTPPLVAAGRARWILDDASGAALSDADYRSHAVIFKRTTRNHTDTSRYFPQQIWAAGW